MVNVAAGVPLRVREGKGRANAGDHGRRRRRRAMKRFDDRLEGAVYVEPADHVGLAEPEVGIHQQAEQGAPIAHD